MATPRSKKMDLEITPFYHCITRCVRRAFLYGVDKATGKDYSHRKSWILSRLKTLAGVFAIDVCAYAILSNHYHLVLHVDKARVKAWDDETIQMRWGKLFPNDAKQLKDLPLDEAQDKLLLWRERLSSISWFMRCLNEYVARICNQEDDCKGRFWEGRFKSQALLDEGAILSAMAYVDLNPVRAKMAKTIEESDFTSIQERIRAAIKDSNEKGTKKSKTKPREINWNKAKQPSWLMTFNQRQSPLPSIDFKLSDYLELVDTTARVIREDKRGATPASLAPILSRLNLNPDTWLDMVQHLETKFFDGVGEVVALIQFTKKNKNCHPRGVVPARQFYKESA